jgi:phage tail sheath protein FI
LSDAVDRGITVTEIAPMDQPIAVLPETTAAFVGRALRGPLNVPVLVTSFGEFQRRFGKSWSRSSLGPSARQFFDHGGRRLHIVRVANKARGAMICLPAGGSALVLRALEPGSTEIVRAAVDLDGIDPDRGDLFNLTLQRLDPASGRIEDQEIHRNVSHLPDGDRFVGDVLLASTLARVEAPYPSYRPECTLDASGAGGSGYAMPVQAGSDGTELSDYDLIGSRAEQTGLFALDQVEDFDILYLPPPGKGLDTGPAAVLAAELYCRERRAMLIVDPRAEWATASEAARGVRDLGYASPNIFGYYPRLRQKNVDDIARPAGGAIAGLLCRQDRTSGPWSGLDRRGLALQRPLVPAVEIGDEEAKQLRRAGINAVVRDTAGRSRVVGDLTMGRGAESHSRLSCLPTQRFCLRVISSIARAARWAVFEPVDSHLGERVRGQVLAYFEELRDLGAFANDRFIVECDAGVSERSDKQEHGVTVLLVFQPSGSREPLSLTLHVTASGCRVGSAAFAPTVGNYEGAASRT